eukprot:6207808-Pleurochrysis_carterae.AAC.1
MYGINEGVDHKFRSTCCRARLNAALRGTHQSCHAKSGPEQWPADSHMVSGRFGPRLSLSRAY